MFIAVAMTDEMSVIVIGTLFNVPFATILAVFFLKETLGWKRILGLLLSFVGIGILAFDPKGFTYLNGLTLVLVSAFFYATGTIFMKRLKGVHPLTLQAWILLIGFPFLISVSYFYESGQLLALENASFRAGGSIVYSAIAASIIGHGSIYFLLQKYPVTTIAPQTLMAQFFAIIFSVMFLGDILTRL